MSPAVGRSDLGPASEPSAAGRIPSVTSRRGATTASTQTSGTPQSPRHLHLRPTGKPGRACQPTSQMRKPRLQGLKCLLRCSWDSRAHGKSQGASGGPCHAVPAPQCSAHPRRFHLPSAGQRGSSSGSDPTAFQLISQVWLIWGLARPASGSFVSCWGRGGGRGALHTPGLFWALLTHHTLAHG